MTGRKPLVLVVDDKPNMLRLMTKVLKGDAVVRTAEGGAEALKILACEPVDVVLCDLKMPDMDGLDVLKAAKRLRPGAEFVLMTAYATVGTAVEALKLGAYDYLAKPFEPEEARQVVLRALTRVQPGSTDSAFYPEILPGVVAQSSVMQDVAGLVRRLAASQTTTLVLGETGTGKERVARSLHELSPRASRRFVAVNCAAIPADLLESELFGHTRGAFTGALVERKGLFEEADGGTLFLDEIGDMRPSLQAKLTRVLEERMIRRVGESRERPVDVRLVAATHRDLASMVEAGVFRQDLWYRLNVAQVELPPLRHRPGDIELLARYFLREQSSRRDAPLSFSQVALDALRVYDWPGNVRQLRSAVERASVVASGVEIELGDLPAEVRRGGNSSELLVEGTWSDAVERGRLMVGKGYLEAVLQKYDGSVSDAAAHAGVERESFYRLLRKYGVDVSTFRSPEV